jgi:MraZ protein
MLVGQYLVRKTAKGRLAIPAKMRKDLGNKLVVAKWYEGCLVVVSENKWRVLLDRLTGRSEIITSPVRDTDRFILGSAFETHLDSQGRFVLPKLLETYANLGKEVVIVGLGDRAEIWDSEEWIKREKYISQKAPEMLEDLAKGAR